MQSSEPVVSLALSEPPASLLYFLCLFFFFSSRRRHTRCLSDWSSDVCSSDLTYFQGFLVEISARKEAEAARAEAERRYRTMVEALPAVTYIDEPTEGDDINAKIGRASCRERV